ncbi:unnamed protein product [Brassica rapa subsp. trilocularis]
MSMKSTGESQISTDKSQVAVYFNDISQNQLSQSLILLPLYRACSSSTCYSSGLWFRSSLINLRFIVNQEEQRCLEVRCGFALSLSLSFHLDYVTLF